MALERQSAKRPPAFPSCILRGHGTAIHSAQFVHHNSHLLTGDADGWVILWKVQTKRALVVWKAHNGSILGIAEWGNENIITHGRDNTLRVWQFQGEIDAEYDGRLSKILPTEPNRNETAKPWLLHTLPVNTLNFCAFSMCYQNSPSNMPVAAGASSTQELAQPNSSSDSILIAVVARDDKKMEVYELPAEKLRFIVPRVQSIDTGMVMAVKLVHHQPSNSIVLLAGYEGGVTAAFKLPRSSVDSVAVSAQLLYLSKPHDQPILSLDASPDGKEYFTSSADAKIAMHHIPELPPDICEEVQYEEDNQSRLASKRKLSPQEELAQARKLHQRSIAQEDMGMTDAPPQLLDLPDLPLSFTKQVAGPSQHNMSKPSGLSSLLSSAEPQANIQPAQLPPPVVTVQPPYKVTDTKHAGQQSLRVRSDGRLVVTGGWDARVRIYSAKTLKEVAVLKWHKEGVYAIAVGAMMESNELPKRIGEWAKFQQMREAESMLTHWVAAGAKDGKVSLWEVF